MIGIFTKLSIAVIALGLSAGLAFAAVTLDQAKQQGLVGERPDGLLGIVGASSPDVVSLVDSTNAERMAKYKSIADKNGTAIDQVQALAGQKLISGAGSGEFIMNAGGGWQKK